ncbi:peptide deformylase [Methylocystis sp. Sn-Cys]|uniref:peptide deformylase n=1 Tax=Methylocystis sp. Sn-Cys TaxID=1701263 RepID=UPI001AEDD70F|nr:peptide deformylase [Methylocystis sp. Sn-Cys]
MALLPIITLPDPRLRKVSQPVERVDAEILQLLDDMLETMYEAPGVGLAAIQVAVAKRIVVIDPGKTEEERSPLFLINPEIIWASEELSSYNEGCLSVPDYFDDVKRPARVRVRHLDRAGERQEFDADGFLATVVQHELEHLEGGLFIDNLSRLKRERVVKKFTKAARMDEIVAQRRADAARQSEDVEA